MKKFFTYIILILISLSSYTQEISSVNSFEKNLYDNTVKDKQDNGHIYRDLGYYTHYFSNGTYIKFRAYILKRLNKTGHYSQFKYVYELTAQSESYNGTRVTQTWLYNNRVYYNGKELTYHQFPHGMTTYINTSPTPIYSWFTSDVEISAFWMEWSNSVYENR